MNKDSRYDVVIIGAGPAGLTASIYASRYKLSNLVIGKKISGELSLAHKVDNYPGLPSFSGVELGKKWKEHVQRLGASVLVKEVGKLEKVSGGFVVRTDGKEKYYAKAVIVATGTERRRLNIPGEREYLGKGVSYCTTCDAPFFNGKEVALIGGSDAAVSGAIHVAEFAKKTYIICRRDKLRAEPVWVEEWKKTEKQGKGETVFKMNVVEILGDENKVTGVKLDNSYKGKDELVLDGVFVEIGGVPGTTLVGSLGVGLDDDGYVKVNLEMNTNVEGLFCAGDMTDKSKTMKQAIIAMAQGARAAAAAYKFIKKETAPIQRGV